MKWLKEVLRTLFECFCIMIVFAVLFVIFSFLIYGRVDWY